jgi:hypothetical protein
VTRKAMLGALRREGVAKREAAALAAEIEALQGLLREKELDVQRAKMIIKLKEGRIERLEVRPKRDAVPSSVQHNPCPPAPTHTHTLCVLACTFPGLAQPNQGLPDCDATPRWCGQGDTPIRLQLESLVPGQVQHKRSRAA